MEQKEYSLAVIPGDGVGTEVCSEAVKVGSAAAAGVKRAMQEVLAGGRIRTRDMGGSSPTEEVGDAVAERV